MDKTLTYLFDPLCGWCYGASARLARIVEETGVQLSLLPTGLFAGNGARPMDDDLAAHVWCTDQRIGDLTGQCFSCNYRDHVFSNLEQDFDSGPATLALTAVARCVPQQEFVALQAIQRARYVHGSNIVTLGSLERLLAELGLPEAADSLRNPDRALLQANQARIDQARELMRNQQLRGVPAFIMNAASQPRNMTTGLLFTQPEAFAEEIGQSPVSPAVRTGS